MEQLKVAKILWFFFQCYQSRVRNLKPSFTCPNSPITADLCQTPKDAKFSLRKSFSQPGTQALGSIAAVRAELSVQSEKDP